MIVNKNTYQDKNGKDVKIVQFIFNEKNVKQSKSGNAYICTAFLDSTVDTTVGEVELGKLINLSLVKDSKSKVEYIKDNIDTLTDKEKAMLKALLK